MKTIRLLYPDYLAGGLDTYYFGAHLLTLILPPNANQPLLEVSIAPPDGQERPVTGGIRARSEVVAGILKARELIEAANPDRIITIGGNCIVSQAPFDYLHGRYNNVGLLWIDAHPDVSTPDDGYPNAHAMVLGALLGHGDDELAGLLEHGSFSPDQVLYIGLQGLHAHQEKTLQDLGVDYTVQTEQFVSKETIRTFLSRFEHSLVHFDIDVMDPAFFHSTYFANPELVGDGSGGGRMRLEELSDILKYICSESDVVGLTIAEYLPFDEHRLRNVFEGLELLTADS